jgi:hypothetical protein
MPEMKNQGRGIPSQPVDRIVGILLRHLRDASIKSINGMSGSKVAAATRKNVVTNTRARIPTESMIKSVLRGFLSA